MEIRVVYTYYECLSVYDCLKFNKLSMNSNTDLLLLNFNMRSIGAYFDIFNCFTNLLNKKFDILCFSESWLRSDQIKLSGMAFISAPFFSTLSHLMPHHHHFTSLQLLNSSPPHPPHLFLHLLTLSSFLSINIRTSSWSPPVLRFHTHHTVFLLPIAHGTPQQSVSGFPPPLHTANNPLLRPQNLASI